MSKVTTYNPKKVTCALGRHIVSGFADDSFISIEPAGDGTSYVVGADGEIARSIDPSNVYTIKLALLQASATNKYLQKKYDKDKKDGTGTFSVKAQLHGLRNPHHGREVGHRATVNGKSP